MAGFSELVKTFEKTKSYIRDFFICGFRMRSGQQQADHLFPADDHTGNIVPDAFSQGGNLLSLHQIPPVPGGARRPSA